MSQPRRLRVCVRVCMLVFAFACMVSCAVLVYVRRLQHGAVVWVVTAGHRCDLTLYALQVLPLRFVPDGQQHCQPSTIDWCLRVRGGVGGEGRWHHHAMCVAPAGIICFRKVCSVSTTKEA